MVTNPICTHIPKDDTSHRHKRYDDTGTRIANSVAESDGTTDQRAIR